jgi:phosphoenolpyruvate carboxylase
MRRMGLELEAHELPQVLAFGSWIGGDRDGNPFVTPEVTRNAIQLAREHLLHFYDGQLQRSSTCSAPRRSRCR